MNELDNIENSITSMESNDLLLIILYGDKKFDKVTNRRILNVTIEFIKNSKRFDEALF